MLVSLVMPSKAVLYLFEVHILPFAQHNAYAPAVAVGLIGLNNDILTQDP